MGQRIEVTTTVVGEVLLLDTDRSLTGQDGAEYGDRDAAASDDSFPGRLAARLYAADELIGSVFIGSNGLVIRREGGWDDAAVAASSAVVSDFFLFYPEGR